MHMWENVFFFFSYLSPMFVLPSLHLYQLISTQTNASVLVSFAVQKKWHKFNLLCYSFHGSEVQAQLSWVLCWGTSPKIRIQVLARLHSHPEAWLGKDLLLISSVASRVHFLLAVEFMADTSSKPGKGSLCGFKCLTCGPALKGFTWLDQVHPGWSSFD